jgi:hypothetical protein
MEFDELLGAFYSWTKCRWLHCWFWTKLYWPVTDSAWCRSQCPLTQPHVGQAGYRDGRRGRHWDRRRR